MSWLQTIRSWNPCHRERSVIGEIRAWREKMKRTYPGSPLKLLYRLSREEAIYLAAELHVPDVDGMVVSGVTLEVKA